MSGRKRLILMPLFVTIVLIFAVIPIKVSTQTIMPGTQQCDCGGRYINVPDGTNCVTYCGGGGYQYHYIPPQQQYDPRPGLINQLNGLNAQNAQLRGEVNDKQGENIRLRRKLQLLRDQLSDLQSDIVNLTNANQNYEKQLFGAAKKDTLGQLKGLGDQASSLKGLDDSALDQTGIDKEDDHISCSQTLNTLKNEAASIHGALKILDKSMSGNQEVRKESEQDIGEAVEGGADDLVGLSLELTGHLLDDGLDSVTRQSDEIILERNEGKLNRSQRKQYEKAYQMLLEWKNDFLKAKNRFEYVERADQVMEIDGELSDGKTTKLEKVYDTTASILTDSLVQKSFKYLSPAAMKFLEPTAATLEYAGPVKEDLEAAYLLGKEYVAWQNIMRMNTNSEQYLKAVNNFKSKLELIMKNIDKVQNQMQKGKAFGCG